MMEREEMMALAERVEQAAGPGRELDAHIACAVLGREFICIASGEEAYGDICDPGDRGYGTGNKATPGLCYARLPENQHGTFGGGEKGNTVQGFTPKPYTASLDAAMTLAKDFGGQLTFFKDGTAKAFLWQPYPLAVEAKAATPALALTAACLRALTPAPNNG